MGSLKLTPGLPQFSKPDPPLPSHPLPVFIHTFHPLESIYNISGNPSPFISMKCVPLRSGPGFPQKVELEAQPVPVFIHTCHPLESQYNRSIKPSPFIS